MEYKILFFMVIALFFTGCSDMLSTRQKYIVGDISVMNPNNESGSHWNLAIYKAEGFNSNVVEEYLIDLSGNDSILLLKCIDPYKCNFIFYKINHQKGKEPLTINKIESDVYLKLLRRIKSGYNFHTDVPSCNQ